MFQQGFVPILIDDVAFDENEKMRVIGENQNVIAYFDRFWNKNGDKDGLKVFDVNKKLICSVIPKSSGKYTDLHIRYSDGKRGKVRQTNDPNILKFQYETDISIEHSAFPYKMDVEYMHKALSVCGEFKLKTEAGKLIGFAKFFHDMQNEDGVETYYIDSEFYKSNKNDIVIFALLAKVLHELMDIKVTTYNPNEKRLVDQHEDDYTRKRGDRFPSDRFPHGW